MSLSDCPKCWDTLCTCGYQYRNHSATDLSEVVLGMLSYHSPEARQEIMTAILDKYPELKIDAPKQQLQWPRSFHVSFKGPLGGYGDLAGHCQVVVSRGGPNFIAGVAKAIQSLEEYNGIKPPIITSITDITDLVAAPE